MSVRLIGITQPVIDGVESADDLIAYTARVSNPSNQMSMETAPKLIDYLIRNQHWSPFEMVHVLMEVKTTRDISRQMLRHRSFSFQEFSQRYAEAEEFVTRETRLQDPKNRQNSIEIDPLNPNHLGIDHHFMIEQRDLLELATRLYNNALNDGIAKEQARALLPEGLTCTTLYMSGSVRSWLHYVALRASNGTQKEHKIIALKALEVLAESLPSLRGYLLGVVGESKS